MSVKLLLTGNYCSSNRGDAAIIDGMLHDIRRTFGDCEIKMTSMYPEVARKVHGVEAGPPWFWTSSRSAVISAKLRYGLGGTGLAAPPPLYRWADAAVAVGGSYLHDKYHPAIVGRLLELEACMRAGLTTFIYSQSIGPFDRPKLRSQARVVLRRVDGLTVREGVSRDLVEDLTGTRPELAPDAAFMAPGGRGDMIPKEVEGIRSAAGGDGGYVTVSVREIAGFYGPDMDERMFRELAAALVRIQSEHGMGVVLVPMCTDMGGYHHDDRKASRHLLGMIGEGTGRKNGGGQGKGVHVMDGEPSYRDIRAVISGARAHIGLRMHSNILALSAGVPVIGIGYEHKTRGIMSDMGLSRYHLEADRCTRKRVCAAFDSIDSDHDRVKKRVVTEARRARKEAHRSTAMLKKLVDR